MKAASFGDLADSQLADLRAGTTKLHLIKDALEQLSPDDDGSHDAAFPSACLTLAKQVDEQCRNIENQLNVHVLATDFEKYRLRSTIAHVREGQMEIGRTIVQLVAKLKQKPRETFTESQLAFEKDKASRRVPHATGRQTLPADVVRALDMSLSNPTTLQVELVKELAKTEAPMTEWCQRNGHLLKKWDENENRKPMKIGQILAEYTRRVAASPVARRVQSINSHAQDHEDEPNEREHREAPPQDLAAYTAERRQQEKEGLRLHDSLDGDRVWCLEMIAEQSIYPEHHVRQYIGAVIGMADEELVAWFQHHRCVLRTEEPTRQRQAKTVEVEKASNSKNVADRFTISQLLELEIEYNRPPNSSTSDLKQLSRRVGLSSEDMNMWFEYRHHLDTNNGEMSMETGLDDEQRRLTGLIAKLSTEITDMESKKVNQMAYDVNCRLTLKRLEDYVMDKVKIEHVVILLLLYLATLSAFLGFICATLFV